MFSTEVLNVLVNKTTNSVFYTRACIDLKTGFLSHSLINIIINTCVVPPKCQSVQRVKALNTLIFLFREKHGCVIKEERGFLKDHIYLLNTLLLRCDG